MKTNYFLLFFNFIISIFMYLSLNSFSGSSMYLPILFLYFISNAAAFVDKFTYYSEINLYAEKIISILCFFVSIAMVCIYIFNSLGYIQITFQNTNGIYRMLMQGVPESFFTFTSIDITNTTFIIASFIPITYAFFIVSSVLRSIGFTRNKVFLVIKNKYKLFITIPGISLICGYIGTVICEYKYQAEYEGFGYPQYTKYFWVFFIGAFAFFFFLFLFISKDKDHRTTSITDQPQE